MDSRERVLDYLQSHRVMTLATADTDGPAAAAVFYVNQGLNFYFLSAPHTRHCRNMLADPRVGIAVQEDSATWSTIKGVQMSALGRELDRAELAGVQRLYAAKFPEVFDPETAGGAIARALMKVHWYQLTVNHLRFIDNAVGFGHRQEWSRAQFTAFGSTSA